INVAIYKGEKIAVLGSNGSGKSTFFLNCNGVYTPCCGNIYYRQEKITYTKKCLANLRKNVGLVFQEPDNQIIASTVFGEVSFGPNNLKLDKNEVAARTEKAIDIMNLTGMKNLPPHYLSGGEKKRVCIADILAMHPEIILFDEPAAFLDPINAQMLENTLAKLCDDGITVVVSTHDVDFAYRWASRIIVFNAGEIMADGTPEQIFDDDELINKCGLKKPMLYEIVEIVEKSNGGKNIKSMPKNISEFKKYMESKYAE
ncbi:MAG TPA: ATP-binding protein, partial [Ruminococcaceae bacterium]|nr:ATP-binding protein [Oscillospiraceae bacterium]